MISYNDNKSEVLPPCCGNGKTGAKVQILELKLFLNPTMPTKWEGFTNDDKSKYYVEFTREDSYDKYEYTILAEKL